MFAALQLITIIFWFALVGGTIVSGPWERPAFNPIGDVLRSDGARA